MNFRELEGVYGIFYEPEKNPSSLSDWYTSVRDLSLDELDVGDVCRCIRQDVFVSDVLPFAISMLHEDVLAGDFYDGELVTAPARLGERFWRLHVEELASIAHLLHEVLNLSDDKQLHEDVSKMINLIHDLRVSE